MKKILLSIGLLLSVSAVAQNTDCGDLFISEYVEGWYNNKAIEIYNPTDQAIDLSSYMMMRYSNGAMFASPQNSTQLTGTIQPYDVYVMVLDKRDPLGEDQEAPVWDELQNKADAFYNPVYGVKNTFYFNGNDALVLALGNANDPSNATAVDIFGKIGEDPATGNYGGWTSESPFVNVGVDVTKDHSLIRKPGVKKGVTTNPGLFNPLAEWDSIPPITYRFDANGDTIFNENGNPTVDGNWSTLGTHTCDCGTVSLKDEASIHLSVSPNPSSNGEFKLTSDDEIVEVEVYNAIGEKVYTQKNNAGIQSISIGGQAGVYLLNLKTERGIVSSKRLIVK